MPKISLHKHFNILAKFQTKMIKNKKDTAKSLA